MVGQGSDTSATKGRVRMPFRVLGALTGLLFVAGSIPMLWYSFFGGEVDLRTAGVGISALYLGQRFLRAAWLGRDPEARAARATRESDRTVESIPPLRPH